MDTDEIQNEGALAPEALLEEAQLDPGRRQEKMEPDAEIVYLCLTFKTPLPLPNIVGSNSPGAPASKHQAPACPDLTPYSNPLGWPSSRKNMVLFLSCAATFLTAYTSGSYSPPQDLIREDLGASSNVAVLAGITTFCVGFALAPMFLAPFSEMNGRYPVFVVSGIVYVVFQAVCGVVRNLAGMLIARLFVGIGGSVFSTMVGGVIADMWYAPFTDPFSPVTSGDRGGRKYYRYFVPGAHQVRAIPSDGTTPQDRWWLTHCTGKKKVETRLWRYSAEP
jgi:hypothetical protein